jgi:hypothetical protein
MTTEAEKAAHRSFVGTLMEFATSLWFANAIAWLANTSGQIFLINNDPVLGCPKTDLVAEDELKKGGNLEPD